MEDQPALSLVRAEHRSGGCREVLYHLWDLRPPQPGTRHMEPVWQKSPISMCPCFWMPDLRHPVLSLWRSRVTATPLVFMLLHNRSGLFMAASQSQRRKAHCSALVPRACRDTAAGTLSLSAATNGVCQCCRQPLDAAGKGRLSGGKALAGQEGQTLDTGPHWVQEWDVTCYLPVSSPYCPLAILPQGTFLFHTHPPLCFSPITYTPSFSSLSWPDSQHCWSLSFGSLAVRAYLHLKKWPCRRLQHGAANSLPLGSSSSRKMSPL